ncbi:glutathione S-transferase family protein [Photobacterium aphoticum]|uniref:Glutathione S-transferase n=1 Tax=Photobacterium aphoticum TaxID=754436 RepID=A0A090R4I7_9GAMM|nr:glutathione S-transferase family protein [Photobacterium aphoticum]KLU98395.1 glutathione S-transferase [Photobacterium aphoticum]PSU50677.1 glutathione S-transferase family protein [Photobacterium aphoticum]GAL09019.1 glutathione S-transferase [Photobacterium aphoticum]GHA56703.1 glutathione S-transferase [Photobacterium aphoticum]
MLTLYGYPQTRSLRVSWLLEELGLDWHYHPVHLHQNAHRAPTYLAINAQGKVPCLTDDDLTISESTAICLYLAEKYGQHWLPEPGSADSAHHHEWISFITTELEQALWSMGKHRFALPESIRLPEMLPVAAWECRRALKTAEQRVPETGFLFGHFPTVADLLLAHTLNWAAKFEQKIPLKLEKYRQFVSRRPALARAVEREQRALQGT